jgi:hypothetical protein
MQPTAMAALAVPATQKLAEDLYFREKAFWTFSRGQRLGDMRRLIRSMVGRQDQVFPVGEHYRGGNYGADVNLPVPQAEENNPALEQPAGVYRQEAPNEGIGRRERGAGGNPREALSRERSRGFPSPSPLPDPVSSVPARQPARVQRELLIRHAAVIVDVDARRIAVREVVLAHR